MAGHGSKYRALKENAIAALIATGDVAKAAQTVGLPRRTLAGWTRRPDFAEDWAAARRLSLTAAVSKLAETTTEAADVLKECLKAPKEADRIKAARAILSFASQDLFQRVEAMEKEISDIKRNGILAVSGTILHEHISISPEALRSYIKDRTMATTPKRVIDAPTSLPAPTNGQQDGPRGIRD
jgi:hypothetical protein